MKLQAEERARQKQADIEYAAERRKEIREDEEKEERRKVLAKGRALQQLDFLNQQVQMQKDQRARDPASGEMTALEATINRPLLVSIVQHTHTRPNPLT